MGLEMILSALVPSIKELQERRDCYLGFDSLRFARVAVYKIQPTPKEEGPIERPAERLSTLTRAEQNSDVLADGL